jgi:hypothetical protein
MIPFFLRVEITITSRSHKKNGAEAPFSGSACNSRFTA